MKSIKPARSEENKVIMAKLSREEFAKLQTYCEIKNESVNSVVKRLVAEELENPVSYMVAGKNVFVYNPAKDNFNWKAVLDKGIISYIGDDLNFEFLSQLKEAIDLAIEERNTFIQKHKDDSVAMPSKILRRGL